MTLFLKWSRVLLVDPSTSVQIRLIVIVSQRARDCVICNANPQNGVLSVQVGCLAGCLSTSIGRQHDDHNVK